MLFYYTFSFPFAAIDRNIEEMLSRLILSGVYGVSFASVWVEEEYAQEAFVICFIAGLLGVKIVFLLRRISNLRYTFLMILDRSEPIDSEHNQSDNTYADQVKSITKQLENLR